MILVTGINSFGQQSKMPTVLEWNPSPNETITNVTYNDTGTIIVVESTIDNKSMLTILTYNEKGKAKNQIARINNHEQFKLLSNSVYVFYDGIKSFSKINKDGKIWASGEFSLDGKIDDYKFTDNGFFKIDGGISYYLIR
jgi:hypothetical protein